MQILELDSQQPVINKLLGEIQGAAVTHNRVNHTIIVGRSGVGKTTILRELHNRILNDPKLNENFRVIASPFLFNAKKIESVLEQIIANADISTVTKQHLLLIDDLDLLFGDSDDEAHQLRKILLRSEPMISLIATADFSLKDKLTHDRALYGFTRILEVPELDDRDVVTMLNDATQESSWKKINSELSITNTFWLQTITGANARLIAVLKNIICSSRNPNMTPDDFIKQYFEFTGPLFLNELMELPKNNRHFLEAASLLGRSFNLKDVDVDITNLSQEALRLQHRGYLDKKEKGAYSFHFSPLKAWLRYAKNIPLGLVLNVDIEANQSMRYL